MKAAGGQMEVMRPVKFIDTEIPDGKDITTWEVYQDVLDTGVLINVPIAKTHNLSRLTLGGKNLLRVISRPEDMHRALGSRVANLMTLVRPALTVGTEGERGCRDAANRQESDRGVDRPAAG